MGNPNPNLLLYVSIRKALSGAVRSHDAITEVYYSIIKYKSGNEEIKWDDHDDITQKNRMKKIKNKRHEVLKNTDGA